MFAYILVCVCHLMVLWAFIWCGVARMYTNGDCTANKPNSWVFSWDEFFEFVASLLPLQPIRQWKNECPIFRICRISSVFSFSCVQLLPAIDLPWLLFVCLRFSNFGFWLSYLIWLLAIGCITTTSCAGDVLKKRKQFNSTSAPSDAGWFSIRLMYVRCWCGGIFCHKLILSTRILCRSYFPVLFHNKCCCCCCCISLLSYFTVWFVYLNVGRT